MTTKSPIPHQFSQWLAYAYDVAISSGLMATVLIWRYRFEPKPLPSDMVWRATVAFAVITAVVYPLIRLHRGLWRFTTLSDVLRIAQAVAFANLVLVPTLFITDRLTDFPRTGLLIEAPLLVLILTASRLAVRVWRRGDLAAALQFEDRSAPWAVIVGDHSAAADYLSELRRLGGPALPVPGRHHGQRAGGWGPDRWRGGPGRPRPTGRRAPGQCRGWPGGARDTGGTAPRAGADAAGGGRRRRNGGPGGPSPGPRGPGLSRGGCRPA